MERGAAVTEDGLDLVMSPPDFLTGVRARRRRKRSVHGRRRRRAVARDGRCSPGARQAGEAAPVRDGGADG